MMTEGEQWQPLVVLPTAYDVAPTPQGLSDLIGNGLDVDGLLTEHRALLFKGFDITRDTLDGAIDLFLPNRAAYTHGNTPRSNLGGNIYTSTEYPADQSISMHNELSYASAWPSRLLFYCEQPAETGGATPLADAANWLQLIDPEVRDAFAGGLRYAQNLHGGRGLGKSWQQTFETDNRDEVEAFLAEGRSSWTWTSTGLRVTQERAATTHHPVTGEEVWFNQVDQWHPAGLPEDVRTIMTQMFTEADLPQSVTFRDGSPIPAEYVLHVREMGWKQAYDIDWETSNLALVDNVLAAHARRPYTGERRVLVAMSA
ncbi:SyrP-like protein [Rhodococcus aetherivorans]|uniref:SyrP-like protein n=2 Tax=Rhodococcus aetherivorans TaxID=191292 RepID=A0ABQ0YLM8_9NOCA|nr:TauD/TfdA family dioxygenase [Rhodococcus aetherivorans]GES37423.1 SyrP-like protein [Rhodococcus aetherivorans]